MNSDIDQRPGRLLLQAAIYNNVELMESLLEGPELEHINAVDSFGRTALYTSVTNNSYECCQLLLLAGGMINDWLNDDDNGNGKTVVVEIIFIWCKVTVHLGHTDFSCR